ncbi:Metacaspase type II [Mycena sanguinolenta]|uniref:Metacaspase type II n=1 Tax=Mycena sanguinolenta TaxID=230812 RepID=A0A8H6Y0G6_9AGAR|nr:Metacaspase type II [Mycena sanguinolenta]
MAERDESMENQPRPSVRPKHKALLIGISESAAQSLHKDHPEWRTARRDVKLFVKLVRNLLIDYYSYRDEDITVLLDDGISADTQPTRANIMNAIKNLVEDAKEGDHFCFYYSGLSTQIEIRSNSEEDGMDDCLIPMDGMDYRILSFELDSVLISPLPVGSHLVAILDTIGAGHARSFLDLQHYRCNRVYVPWISRQPQPKNQSIDLQQVVKSIDSENRHHELAGPRRRRSEPAYPSGYLGAPVESESEFETSSTSGSRVRWLLDEDTIVRSESPVGIFLCSGWCREADTAAEAVEGADVVSFSFFSGSSLEEYKRMTPFLVNSLRRNPKQSFKELLLSINHQGYALSGRAEFENLVFSSSRPLDMERSVQSLFGRGSTGVVGIDTEAGEDISALQAASMDGDLETVRLLLEYGDNNEAGDEYGRALRAASMNGHTDIVALLLEESGAKVGASGEELTGAAQDVNKSAGMLGRALQVAALAGNVEIVRILLEFGASIDSAGAQYVNVLKATLRNGYTDAARLLLDHGASTLQESLKYCPIAIFDPYTGRLRDTHLKSCRSWGTFRDRLIEEGVQPMQYIQNDEFVVRAERPAINLVSQEDWMGWMSLLCSASTARPVPWVTLCIIRPETEPCCDNPIENIASSKCESCGMAIVNPPAKQGFPAPTSQHISPTIPASFLLPNPQPQAAVTKSGELSATQNTPASAPLTSMPSPAPPSTQSFTPPSEPVAAVPSHSTTAAARTTAFELTAKNSVMRRRNRRISTSTRAQAPSVEPDDQHRTTPIVNAQEPTPWIKIIALEVLRRSLGILARFLERSTKRLVRIIGHCFIGLYCFVIAPPFLIHKGLEWDRARLENRLAIFQWTMAGNLSLAGPTQRSRNAANPGCAVDPIQVKTRKKREALELRYQMSYGSLVPDREHAESINIMEIGDGERFDGAWNGGEERSGGEGFALEAFEACAEGEDVWIGELAWGKEGA